MNIQGKNTKLRSLTCRLMIFLCIHVAFAAFTVSAETENQPVGDAKKKPAIIHINAADSFKKEVLEKPGVTVVNFHATWCPACVKFKPVLKEAADKREKGLNFVQIDVDKAMELAAIHKVEYLPTTLVFKEGKEQERIVGAASKKELTRVMKKVCKLKLAAK